jgi:diaminopimelate decarboxylase
MAALSIRAITQATERLNFMDHFAYHGGALHAEDVPLAKIAEAVGTPFYCYSAATLTHQYKTFTEALEGLDAVVCFAVKANANLAVLRTLAKLGAGGDVVSGGELTRALIAGMPADKIVFSGVGKTEAEIEQALVAGIRSINAESVPELDAINRVAKRLGKTATVTLRINPDVDAHTHAKITTGLNENKFGIEWTEAHRVIAEARDLGNVRIVGLAVHIGSQLTQLEPFREAFIRVRDLVAMLRADGIAITHLDLGGGLGIPYEQGGETPNPPDYGKIVRETVGDLGCKLAFEPGRLIVGNAGILVTKVIYMKDGATRRFAIVDAAMNDLIRPALYDAKHEIVPVSATNEPPEIVDVVGPVCETGDTFATQLALAPVKAGDLLAIRSAGAYGAVMSSTYNSRDLIPEVLVQGHDFAIVRKRMGLQAFLDHEQYPDWLDSR